MSFLDNLENNLKSLESSEQGKEDAERAHRTRESERAQAQAAAPFAEQLKQSPYTAELLKQAARVGFSLRTKVHIAWLGSTLRLEARDKRLELRPTAQGYRRRLYRERPGSAHRTLRSQRQSRRPGARSGSPETCAMQKPAFDPGLTQKYTGNFRRVINKDGTFNVRRRGATWRDFHPYLHLINMGWLPFFALLFPGYLVVNTLFALAYYALGPGYLQGADAPRTPAASSTTFSSPRTR